MKLPIAALAAGAAAAAWFVYRLDPLERMVTCPYLALTGLACPGCGVTRAVHFVLHADPGTAFSYNPLLFLAAPTALAFAAAPHLLGERVGVRWRTSLAWTMMAVTLVFWVWRNTPWYPFLRL